MVQGAIEAQIARCASWPQRFRPEEWSLYKSVIQEARNRSVPFAVGGGLAAMTYAGQWRNTKDLDLYILSRDREEMIGVLTHLGFEDYFEKLAYDRKWIYRGEKDGNIVDLIWAMANQRAAVDETWLQGPEVEAGGELFRLLAPEDALWSKLYVLQHDRCDWPDALNVLYGVGSEMNWCRLLGNVGADVPLLSSLVSAFAWLCPEHAQKLPAWLWSALRLQRPQGDHSSELVRERARLIDSRPWFTPTLDPDP
jgi:putative nucleotidyltransferase-like protein